MRVYDLEPGAADDEYEAKAIAEALAEKDRQDGRPWESDDTRGSDSDREDDGAGKSGPCPGPHMTECSRRFSDPRAETNCQRLGRLGELLGVSRAQTLGS